MNENEQLFPVPKAQPFLLMRASLILAGFCNESRQVKSRRVRWVRFRQLELDSVDLALDLSYLFALVQFEAVPLHTITRYACLLHYLPMEHLKVSRSQDKNIIKEGKFSVPNVLWTTLITAYPKLSLTSEQRTIYI